MIVESDFLNHWKTSGLAAVVGMERALVALLSLWSHCQTRRAWEFQLNALKLAAICRFQGNEQEREMLWQTMLELGWIDPSKDPSNDGSWYEVHQWGEVNASLVVKWGASRGRGYVYPPRGPLATSKDRSNPTSDPSKDPTLDRTKGGTIGLDRIREDTPIVPKGTDHADSASPSSSLPDTQASTSAEGVRKKKGRAVAEVLQCPDHWSPERTETMAQWQAHKREHGKAYKPEGWGKLCARLEHLTDAQLKECVETSMANNWQGLFPERVKQAVAPMPMPMQKNESAAPIPPPNDWQNAWNECYPGMPCPSGWHLLSSMQQADLRKCLANREGGIQ